LRKSFPACTTRSIFPDGCMAPSLTSTMTGISKPGSKHTLEPAHETVLALSVDPSIFTSTWRSAAASHLMCVEPPDLASVSPTVRSVSDSARPRSPMFSPIVRRKVLLIARPPHFDSPPLVHATVRTAIAKAARRLPKVQLITGGRSLGGQMASQTQAPNKVRRPNCAICGDFDLPSKSLGQDTDDEWSAVADRRRD
jgi:hypothetical protein